jgi:PII-like signaling protein
MRKEEFKAKMVRVHFSQKDQWEGKPLHEAILSVCMDLGIAGATVYRGVEGFGLSAHIHRSSVWPGSNDPPIMISIVDREEQIAKLLPRLDEMVSEGVVAISDVEAIRYTNDLPPVSQ